MMADDINVFKYRTGEFYTHFLSGILCVRQYCVKDLAGPFYT